MLRTEIRGALAIATLDRESALNTLNLEMARTLLAHLREWRRAPEIAVIVLRGAGARAFCAGGDVKAVVQELRDGNERYALDFFENEYRLDCAIHDSEKPIVAIGHGFVMGGGLGLLAGATCRVLTDSTSISMPEVSIGFFPDVGASYFLNDLPGKLGLFCALTASRLNAADAIWAGLGDLFIPDPALGEFLTLLEKEPWEKVSEPSANDRNRRRLATTARRYGESFAGQLPPRVVEPLMDEINALLAGASDPANRLSALKRLVSAGQTGDSPLGNAAKTFAAGSPTSAFLTCERIARSVSDLGECFRQDLSLAIRCCQRHDFREGVRALLVDKDRSPHWQPASLESVTPEIIAAHFEPLWSTATHPLRDL